MKLSACVLPAFALLILLSLPVRAADEAAQGVLELDLPPGGGTILLLDAADQADSVRQEYFATSARRSAGKLDRLLLGFYSSPSVHDRAQAMGLSDEQYLIRMFTLYRDLGATTVWAYHGNLANQVGARFADLAGQFGLKCILQPNDVYFRSQTYWAGSTPPQPPFADYKDAADYTQRYLMPRLEKLAPASADNPHILAWGPVEELPGADEPLYASYKEAFKRLLPKHLIFQLDSQQSTREQLQSKKEPYPDITGFDRYPWWTRPEGTGLWTPTYASRLFFSWIRDYPRHSDELFGAPAVLVMQGCAEVSWPDEAWGRKYGWKPEPDFVPPTIPHAKWIAEKKRFRFFNRHFAPVNAWRLQTWMGVAAGYKGFSYWAAGPAYSIDRWREALNSGANARLSIIGDDLTLHPHTAEIANVWADLRRYENLLLDAKPRALPDDLAKALAAEPHLYAGLLEDSAGRRYLVLANGLIGQWDSSNPEVLNHPTTTLTVGLDGELENYVPLAAPRRIRLTLPASIRSTTDLRTLARK